MTDTTGGGETRPAAEPSADTLRRARTFWEQSCADLTESKRRLRSGACLESSYLSVQAAINALTCVCYLHGEYRVPNFSPLRLAALAEGFDAGFAAAGPDAQALETVQELSPFAAERDAGEEKRAGRAYHKHSAAIHKLVRRYLKANRQRFFAP